MDELGATNPNAVEALLWTALLTLIVSRTVYFALAAQYPPELAARMTSKRWAREFREVAPELRRLVLEAEGYGYSLMEHLQISMLLHGDPNRDREHLLDPFLEAE